MKDPEVMWEVTRDLIAFVMATIHVHAEFEVAEEEKRQDLHRLGCLRNLVYQNGTDNDFEQMIEEIQTIRAKYQDVEKFKKWIAEINKQDN